MKTAMLLAKLPALLCALIFVYAKSRYSTFSNKMKEKIGEETSARIKMQK